MSKHTPGPWDYWQQPIEGTYRIRHNIDGNRIIVGVVTREENARLIAAAPDLLAALQAIVNKAHPRADYLNGEATHYIGPKELVDAARAAIAKAEGVS